MTLHSLEEAESDSDGEFEEGCGRGTDGRKRL